MRKASLSIALVGLVLGLVATPNTNAQVNLIAIGSLTSSSAGSFADLSGLHNTLENGAAANLLGGLGSGLAYASGNTFLALPDRGPNAVPFNAAVDDTVTYIPRFHTVSMDLKPNTGAGLPFTLTPTLRQTTLLWSLTPLVYGTGAGLNIGSGVPPQNNFLQHFFTGRSDAFDPNQNSGDPNDARLDSEGIRLSNDGFRVYVSDEYGPYVYEFDRLLGLRLRSFKLPEHLFVADLKPVGADEIAGNAIGRTANKGMEGLAITPDGRTLVGIMQNALLQDAAAAPNLLRIITIDVLTGKWTHEYAYLLTSGSGVSEIVALNSHEFLVDERDGHGRGDNGSKAKVKQIFKIDLAGAVDVASMNGADAALNAVGKSLFLDVVSVLTNPPNSIDPTLVPAKLEGLALGPDVKQGGNTIHTLWLANDNDFLSQAPDKNNNLVPNPNQFFVFGFTNADLAGTKLVPQQFGSFRW